MSSRVATFTEKPGILLKQPKTIEVLLAT